MTPSRLLHCIALAFAITHFHAKAETEKVNYLVVSGIAVPFQINEERNSTGGIISDIVTDIFRETHYNIVPLVASPKRISKLISEHQNHPWITYDAKVWNATAPHGELIDVPLFNAHHSYLTCDEKQKEIRTPEDLRKKRISILSTFNYPELNQLERNLELILSPVRSYHQGFIMASHGRTDGFVEMDIRLRYNLAAIRQPEDKLEECFRFLNMDAVIPPYPIYLSVDRDADEALKALIKKRLIQLKQDGHIQDIVKRYTSVYLPDALSR